MVQLTREERELISKFGQYLFSEERTNNVLNPEQEDNANLTDAEKLNQLYHADVENFMHKLNAESDELTFGQKAVGLRFNPSGSNAVDDCKLISAKFIDLLNEFRDGTDSSNAKRHASVAITEMEATQMRGVKAITWSDN